jgi:NADH-quinone oxidoreductase subunit I
VQYPHEKERPPIRARGVIALPRGQLHGLHAVRRSCPDWCIYIEGHKELARRAAPAGQPRKVQQARPLRHRLRAVHVLRHLRRGVPVRRAVLEPEYEYSEPRIADLLHDKDKLGEWMETVPEAPSSRPARRRRAVLAGRRSNVAQNIGSASSRAMMVIRAARRHDQATSCTPRCGVSSCRRARPVPPVPPSSCRQPGARLHRRGDGAVPFGIMLTRPSRSRADLNNKMGSASRSPCCCWAMSYVLIEGFGDDQLDRRAGLDRRAQRQHLQSVPAAVRALSFVLLAAVIGAIVLARKD